MFNPTLKKSSGTRLTYATPLGFRILFLAIAAFLTLSAGAAAEEPFYEWPPVLLGIILICALAAAYLERWTFDQDTGVVERNVGLLFWHSRNQTALSDLHCVSLTEPGLAYNERPQMMRALSRRTAVLALVDRAGKTLPLDLVKGSTIQQARQLAARVAEFCGITFEDHLGNAAAGTEAEPPIQQQSE